MTYQIERGFPMTPTRKQSQYPFEQMEVGDSFSVPVPIGTTACDHAVKLRSAAYAWGKNWGRSLKVRLDDSRTVARVWRVA